MLDIAGTSAAGTSLGSGGPITIATHIRPKITDAAERAGRPAPRIMALVMVGVTDHPDERRASGREQSKLYAELPALAGFTIRRPREQAHRGVPCPWRW